MALLKVLSTGVLSPGEMRGVKAGSQAVLLVNLAGQYYAIGNVCTHKGCLLSDGDLDREVIQCECHGSRFNVKTGEIESGPAGKPEKVFKVVIEGTQIMVDV
jgi:nitrite reductase/ring-hydroxylating ferredoxin subunit